jgi:hypothetical protein
MLNAIADFFAYILLELLLEGFGALLRCIYQFLFNRPSAEIKKIKKKRRRGDPYNYDFSKNKQVAVVAILLLILIIKIV